MSTKQFTKKNLNVIIELILKIISLKSSPFFYKRAVFVFRYNASGIIILEILLFILLFYHYFYHYIIVIFSGTIISSIISKKRNTSSLC